MIGAIYKAELRANRLLAMAAPVLCTGMYGGIRYLHYTATAHPGYYRSLLDDAFQGIVLITLAAIGLAIGILHTARDTGQGQWAFVMHRPVSPGTIFFGKLASALTIYFLLAAPPVIAAIIWASTPGTLPGPWDWGMARPILIDLFCGTAYILAGMLLVLREARWFGTRVFPAVAAIACSLFTFALPFWGAVLVIPIGWAILLPATWLAIATRYRPSTQSAPSRFLTGLILIPASILIAIMVAAATEATLKPATGPQYAVHRYALSDGQVLDLGFDPIAAADRARVVVNQQDQIVKDAPALPYKPREERLQGVMLSLVPDQWNHRAQAPSNYRAIGHYMAMETGGNQTGMVVWYYVFSRGYLVSYRFPRSGQPHVEQYIGRNGLVPDLSQVERFAPGARASSSFGFFIIEPQRVYETHQRELTGPIFTAPEGETCRDASYMFGYGVKPEDTKTHYVVATDKALYLVDDRHQQLWRMPHPVTKPVVSVAVTPDPDVYIALYEDRPFSDGQAVFVRLRSDGAKLAQLDPPALRTPFHRTYGASDLVPLAIAPPFILAHDKVPKSGVAILLAQAVIAAGVAVVLLRRARATRIAIAWWVLVALAGGVAGLILMAGARHWPLRFRCEACGHRRLAAADDCDHCGAVVSAPDPGPVGIFDQVAEPVRVEGGG